MRKECWIMACPYAPVGALLESLVAFMVDSEGHRLAEGADRQSFLLADRIGHGVECFLCLAAFILTMAELDWFLPAILVYLIPFKASFVQDGPGCRQLFGRGLCIEGDDGLMLLVVEVEFYAGLGIDDDAGLVHPGGCGIVSR